jgi:hypothetical protein
MLSAKVHIKLSHSRLVTSGNTANILALGICITLRAGGKNSTNLISHR